ncbi:MAG: hypothetical protein ACI86M_000681 [Saprospiraceae bacterium]|jgi:hypothetical protein
MKNNSTPKRKLSKKKYRLASSIEWIKTYSGKNLVKGYSKWFGVDLVCAIKELRINGVEVAEKYENEILRSIEVKRSKRQINQEESGKKNTQNEIWDSNFLFIAGYSSGGVPYGLTHLEMEGAPKGYEGSVISELF